MGLQWKDHGSIEIVSNVPAGTPGHPSPFQWHTFDVQPQKITIWARGNGGWKAEVDCRKVKKNGEVSQVDVQVSYPWTGAEVPEYVLRFAEHAQRVQAFAFPPVPTTTED